MVLSAVGIALMSTLFVRETLYKEALAKQRRALIQAQTQRSEKKKKKDKTLEKKSKAKRKEDRPDGKLSEPGSDSSEEPVVVTCTEPEPQSDPEPAVEPDTPPEPKPTPEPVQEPTVIASVKSPPAASPKEKKRKSARMDSAAILETVAKDVLVLVVALVVDVPPVNVVS